MQSLRIHSPSSSGPVSHLSSASVNAEAQRFINDDLEFRTITTLLHILDSSEDVEPENLKVENFKVNPEQYPYLRLLTALSSLLVRDREILAILPKRSGSFGTELFVTSVEELPSSPLLSPSPSYRFLARSPRENNNLELSEVPKSNFGPDITQFILDNWNQSFDSHVRNFENLLNSCLGDHAKSNHAWRNLNIYSLFQSIPKIHRRLHNSTFIKKLRSIDPQSLESCPCVPLGLTAVDDGYILIISKWNLRAKETHPALYSFVESPRRAGLKRRLPDDRRSFLPMFHAFFKWFIAEIWDELSLLRDLRVKADPPETFPSKEIHVARANLSALRYFTWKSDSFVTYIQTILSSKVYSAQHATIGTEIDTLREGSDDSEHDMDKGEEDEAILDIATEFDTDEGQSAGPQSGVLLLAHRCISELRLITANVQHLAHIQAVQQRLKDLRISFQILKYPCSDGNMKPWRDVIADLFSNDAEEIVIKAIYEKSTQNKKFRVFTPDAPLLHFKGQVHCEVVLGCLYSLANGGGDNTWTEIPPDVLRTISSSYNLLAPSNRCCPVCATIISLLSTDKNHQPLQTLSKHSVILPCALPHGLPRPVRRRLLDIYKSKLRGRLLSLSKQSAKVSDKDKTSRPTTI